LLLRKQSGANFSYLLSSFRRVLCPVHWALSLPSTCPLLLPPAWRAERSLSLLLLFSLLGPPPIALAISAAPARNRRGPSCEARVGSGSAVSLHSNYVRGLSLLPDLERYYESSVPDSIAAAIWFTGTTKKSHAYVTVIDCFIILDHEDSGRASGFYSHHHIDVHQSSCSAIRTWSPYHGEGNAVILAQKTDRTRSSYRLVRPGSIHESPVQLSLGDRVEKYHAWLPSVLSFSRSHPTRYGSAKKGPCASLILLVKSSP